MSKPPLPLTAFSKAQRTQALECFAIICPVLEEVITQAQVTRNHDLPKSTIQRWVKNYREKGLAGLANAPRSDKGKSCKLPDQQEPTALTTALTLRQAVWHKEDPHWHVCGIPSTFYTDHGNNFTSKHMEAVAVDLGIELIFSEKGVPRGRGKVERFFGTINQLFLQDLPGYAPSGYKTAEATLTLPAFEQRFRAWSLEGYHCRVHGETECQPQEC